MSNRKRLVVTSVTAAVIVAVLLLLLVGPSSEQVEAWGADWGPLLTLATSALLLAVTAMYVYLTKSMADSARDAALSSKVAAEASQASAAASEAAVDVAFELEPSFGTTKRELDQALARAEASGLNANDPVEDLLASILRWNETTVQTIGATVYVHGCLIKEVTWSESSEADTNVVRSKSVEVNIDLETDGILPQRQHKGESIPFRAPVGLPFDETPSAINAVVRYSFGGAADAHSRQVRWEGRAIWTRRPQEPGDDGANAQP